MDVEALASLESQVSFCKSIVDRVTGSECFILLSGEPQSGRSVICEHVVNATDNKLRAVFIPSSRDMPLQRLRTMFLQQLLPGSNVDKDLNLADALAAERIPHNQKVLVVVDDVDAAGSAFFNELLMLHTQFKGQERFAFLVVCSPLWAEEKMQHINDDSVINMQIPPLAMKDALQLSKHIFAMHNAMRVYNSVSGRLADALAKAGGNLGKIVSITENLMKEPAIPPRAAAAGRRPVSGGAVAQGKQKKHSSSVSIFVSIVCIVIVLACLIPILFGSGIFSSSDEQETSVTVPADGFPVQADGSVSSAAEYDYDDDTGVIPKNVPKGSVDVKAENTPSRSVTLSGEELDRIEGGAVDSGYPRGMERPVAAPQKVVLQRDDNLNRIRSQAPDSDNTAIDVVRPVTPPDPVIPSFANPEEVAAAQAQQQKIAEQMKAEEKKRLEDAAKAKLEADRKAAAAAEKAKELAAAKEKEKEKPAAAAPARPALKAGQIINLADEQKAINAQRTPNAQAAAGSVAEGSLQELLRADGKHFTVQIVSASNRANISAAAGKLSGKYWILETRRAGRPWYVLIAGEYADRAEAARAAAAIPTAVSQGAKPFVRSIAEIKADLGRN